MLESLLILKILGAVILIITCTYFYYKYYVFEYWRKRGVFNVEPTFPTGNIMPLISGRQSQAEFMQNLYKENKTHALLGIYMLHKPYLIINDLDIIKEVLTKQFSSFHDRGLFLNSKIDPLSENLFVMPGKKWRNTRLKLMPAFTRGKVKQIFPILLETGDKLAKYLDSKAELKESIDVPDVILRYSMDIIMSVAFGINCGSFENPNNEIRYWGRRALRPNPIRNGMLMWAPQLFHLLKIPYTDRGVTKFFINLFKNTVEQREANNIERKDFLDLLIQFMKNGYVEPDEDATTETVTKTDTTKIPFLEAAAHAYIFYLGGFETSTATITFCLYELAKAQNIQDKVREDIRTAVRKHGGVTYSAVNDMPYLDKVISETMRKYPPVVFLNRVCTKETWLDKTKTTIAEGTPVVIPVFGIQWDPDIYPEPEKFDPERFSEENVKARHPYAYLPFGEGPRICIASKFGLTQVKLALTSVLHRYRLKPTPDMPSTLEYESGTVVLQSKSGVHLTIEKV